MTSTANTSTSTGNPLQSTHRNGQRANCTSPFDGPYRLNPYADITQGISQFCIMNQDTNKLDEHTNKFPEPYKKEIPSTDSLSTMARKMFSDSNSVNRNPNQVRHPFDNVHKPKSITPPLPTPHANPKRPPSSTNFTHHMSKQTSPVKTNFKKTTSNITSNQNINYEIYDLEKIFDEMTQVKPLIKRFSDMVSIKLPSKHSISDSTEKDNISNFKKSPNNNSTRLNERNVQLTDDEEEDKAKRCSIKPRMKQKTKSEQIATKTTQSSLKAINDLFDGIDTESELENERSHTMHNIKPVENNSAPVKSASSSDESSSSSSSSSSDDDSSSSGSSSSDEDDDSSSSSSSSSSSDEESSGSSNDSTKKAKSLNVISNDIQLTNPPVIKLPNTQNTMFPIINSQLSRPVQRTTPEAKPVFEPKPVLNPPSVNPTPPPVQHEQPANDEMDSNFEEEAQEDSNNITLEGIIENINSPNKKSSSKTTSPILPSTPDSKHELKADQTAKSSSQSSSITFTLSDDEISDDSNASNQNVKNLYSFSSGFSAINKAAETEHTPDDSAAKSDLNNNNNNSLNLSSNLDTSNLDDTLLNDSKSLPFSSIEPSTKPCLKLEPAKNSTPSPNQSLNQPLSAGFVPNLTDENKPQSFMDLIEKSNQTQNKIEESENSKLKEETNDKEIKDENDEEVKNIFSPEEKKKRLFDHNSIKNSQNELKQDSKKLKNDLNNSNDLLDKFDLEKEDSINLLKKIANGDLTRIRPSSPLTNQIVNQMSLEENGLLNSTNGATSSNVADQIQYSADGRPKLIVSIELDLIKILNMNLAPPEPQQAIEPPSEKSEKKLADRPRPKEKESPREKSRERSREKSREKDAAKSHYKDYKRSSVSSSSSRGSDYREKSSRDRDTKSSRSESKAKSSSSKNKSESESKESRRDSLNYKSTSNGQSVKRASILNEDQDLTNTSKKQKLSAEQVSSNSVKSVVKTQNVNKSPVMEKQVRESDAKAQSSKQNAKSTTDAKNASSLVKNSKIEKTSPTKFKKTFDFLNTTLEEQVLHQRGKQKKHEADNEKDKLKKPICYMEAVCYFSLCAIAQYRLKKTSSGSTTSNKSSFDLLKDTYELLRYLYEKLVKPTDNEMFIKKFRVLSNWMEAFINRWLWLMSLKELNMIRDMLKDHYSKQAMAQMNQINPLAHQQHANGATKTSPNEIPPPSPASSIGSSAGSSNSNNVTQNNQNTQQSQSQESSSNSNPQPQHIGLSTQKLTAYSERYFKLTEYNIRSQNFWDNNEHLINDEKYLSDFRDTIKHQIQRDLHIDSQVELFAAYILTGLELFKLNNF